MSLLNKTLQTQLNLNIETGSTLFKPGKVLCTCSKLMKSNEFQSKNVKECTYSSSVCKNRLLKCCVSL